MKIIISQTKAGITFALVLSMLFTMGICAMAENTVLPDNQTTAPIQSKNNTPEIILPKEQESGEEAEQAGPLTAEEVKELEGLYQEINTIYQSIFGEKEDLTNKEYKKRVAPYEKKLDSLEDRMVELEIKAGLRKREKAEEKIYRLTRPWEETLHDGVKKFFESQRPFHGERETEIQEDVIPEEVIDHFPPAEKIGGKWDEDNRDCQAYRRWQEKIHTHSFEQGAGEEECDDIDECPCMRKKWNDEEERDMYESDHKRCDGRELEEDAPPDCDCRLWEESFCESYD